MKERKKRKDTAKIKLVKFMLNKKRSTLTNARAFVKRKEALRRPAKCSQSRKIQPIKGRPSLALFRNLINRPPLQKYKTDKDQQSTTGCLQTVYNCHTKKCLPKLARGFLNACRGKELGSTPVSKKLASCVLFLQRFVLLVATTRSFVHNPVTPSLSTSQTN